LILGLDEESGSGCMEYYKSVEKIPDLGFTPDSKFPVIFAEKGILHLTIGGRFPVQSHSSMQVRLLSISGGERANMIPAECTFSYIIGPSSNKQKVTETVRGKTGHASLPELGENAISKAVMTLAEFFRSLKSTHPFLEFYTDCIHTETDGTRLGIACKDAKTGSLTCNVGLISYTEENVSMTLDIRYPIQTSQDHLIKTICKRIEPYGLSEFSHNGLDPLYVDPKSGFIQVLLGVYNNFTNQKASPISIGGGTYARSIPNIVAYGPVFNPDHDVAHQSGEYIKLNELMDCYHIYREAIKKSCEFLMSKLTCQL
jgi:succinyl-diaminopimelate desuccinylase